MTNFGDTKEEFIKDFKERIVEYASWYYPKEYRKSDEYLKQDIEEKFSEALESTWGKVAILNVMETYYYALKEYEEILGY